MRKKQVWILVAIAVVALVLAAVLGRVGKVDDAVVAATTKKPVDYPRDRALRALRERARATPPAADAGTPSTTKRSSDRLTRALSSPGKDGAVVFEVNALRHSALVEKLLACRQKQAGDDAAGLTALKEQLGIDVTEDVDRVALDSEVLVASGFFEALKVPAELGEGTPWGDAGRIYAMTDSSGKPAYMARAGNDLVMTSTDEAQLKAAIDRAEGRTATEAWFPDGVEGGEVYGLVGADMIKGLLTSTGDSRFAGVADLLTTSALRVAVDDDAALSVDIGARTPDDADDIARALGGAIAVARSDARSRGDTELVALLEQARIVPHDDGSIAFDVAVRGADLLRLAGCDKDGIPTAPTTAPTAPTTAPTTP
ncbi:MAG TPA: hypothetical protein VGF99_11375 [Myxococcota bacterium]